MRARALLAALIAGAAACATAADTTALRASYPEGPLWQGEQLYFAEMRADRVSLYAGGERRTFFAEPGCGPTAIAPYGDGLLILCHLGGGLVAVDAAGRETRRWRQASDGAPLGNPNDASADGRGGVYFSDPGAFSRAAPAEGFVMHLDADGVIRRIAGPLRYPNGVHVEGAALYVSEHLAGRVLRYDIAADGALGEASAFADISAFGLRRRYREAFAESGPDGLEIGPDGDLHVALYGEGRLLRISPAGELVGVIEARTRFLTNVAFSDAGAMALTGAYQTGARGRGQVRIARAPR